MVVWGFSRRRVHRQDWSEIETMNSTMAPMPMVGSGNTPMIEGRPIVPRKHEGAVRNTAVDLGRSFMDQKNWKW